jgi:hypothetical protein
MCKHGYLQQMPIKLQLYRQLAQGVIWMKKSVLLAGLVVLMSLWASASFSDPSSLGPTGTLNVPTALALPAGTFELMLAYDRPKVADTEINIFPILTIGYGFANGEIGINYFDVRDYTAVKGANVKYIIAHESVKSPSIAIGAIYLNGNTAETDVYLSISDNLTEEFRATAGLLYQKPSSSDTSSNLTGMMGVEFGNAGKTTIGLDWIFKDIAAGSMISAVIRQPITKDIMFQIGAGDNARCFIGLSMKFGGK